MLTHDSPTSNRRTVSIGEVLGGRYRVARRLGVGGMGAVYEAEHVVLRTRVAIKVLREEMASEPDHRARFLREARAAASVKNDHVVQILDFGETEDGMAYFVMEFLQGEDLSRLIKREGRLEWPRARHLLLQIASALTAAHEEGIIHRDVKPANVLVFDDPKRGLYDFVKVLDFGIAKVTFGDDELKGLTATGEAFGTPAYMAPELAEGSPAGPGADIYAFGVLAFKILTGELPFTGNSPYQIFARHLREAPPRPSTIEPSIPAPVESVVLTCLAKKPEERFASIWDVRRVLDAIPGDSTAHTFAVTIPVERKHHGSSAHFEYHPSAATLPLSTALAPSPAASTTLSFPRAGITAPSSLPTPIPTLPSVQSVAFPARSNLILFGMVSFVAVSSAVVAVVVFGNLTTPVVPTSQDLSLLTSPLVLPDGDPATTEPDAFPAEADATKTTRSVDLPKQTEELEGETVEQVPSKSKPSPRRKSLTRDKAIIARLKRRLRSKCKTELSGAMVSAFLHPNGTVLDVDVSGGEPTNHSCIDKVVKAQKFPSGEGRKASFVLR